MVTSSTWEVRIIKMTNRAPVRTAIKRIDRNSSFGTSTSKRNSSEVALLDMCIDADMSKQAKYAPSKSLRTSFNPKRRPSIREKYRFCSVSMRSKPQEKELTVLM